jgi:hypothetical protein
MTAFQGATHNRAFELIGLSLSGAVDDGQYQGF